MQKEVKGLVLEVNYLCPGHYCKNSFKPSIILLAIIFTCFVNDLRSITKSKVVICTPKPLDNDHQQQQQCPSLPYNEPPIINAHGEIRS